MSIADAFWLCTNVHAFIKAFSVPEWSLAGTSPA